MNTRKKYMLAVGLAFGMSLCAAVQPAPFVSSAAAHFMTARQIGINLVDTLWERKMSRSQEMGADEWGLQLLENVPEYSTGGALIKFNRFLRLEEIRYPDGKHPKNFRNPHPGTQNDKLHPQKRK